MNDIYIGKEASLSKAFTDNDVREFSKLSLDSNPVHLDEEYAKQTIFKQRIVHGFLCGSLISAVIASKLPGPGSIYLHQELNFKKPVFIDETVTAVITVVDMNIEKSIVTLKTICYKGENEVVIEGKAVLKTY